MNNSGSTQSVLLPFGLFSGFGLILTLAFTAIHLHFPNIYQPRRYLERRPLDLKTMFSWLNTAKIPEDDTLKRVGIDAVVFLRFLWLGHTFFLVASSVGLLFVGPFVGFY